MPYDWQEINTVLVESAAYALDAASQSLALAALSTMQRRYQWTVGDEEPTDTEWDTISKAVALTSHQLMTQIQTYPISGIAWQASPQAEDGWLLADGTVYNAADYPLLFAKLGATYGGDGVDTFGVPDLIGRFVRGSETVGGTGGEDTHTLTESELPAHTHSYGYPSVGVDVEAPGVPDFTAVGNPPTTLQTGATGGGQAHENKPPYLDLYPVIKAYEVALSTLPQEHPAASFIVGEVRWLAVDINSIPAGWFYCNGGAFDKNTYPELFTAIGYKFGGSGDFPKIPDMVHKSAVGADEVSPWPLGTIGGEEDHTLTTSEMPAHTHDVTDYNATGGAADGPQRTLNGSSGTARPTSSVGSGAPHNNMPPYIALTPVIRGVP